MKNKSLHTYLLTALLAASACVMQARAQTASSMLYNATQVLPITSVPSSDYVELNYNISLSDAKELGQDFGFAVCLVSGENYVWNNSAQYLKLSNADEIDALILSKAGDQWKDQSGSVHSNFTPMGEGTVTLKYEGDIISAGVTRHITVDEVVTVVE